MTLNDFVSKIARREGLKSQVTIGNIREIVKIIRDELARDPIIWWNLAAASTALFGLILAVNFVGDAVRDILDPRTLREDQ